MTEGTVTVKLTAAQLEEAQHKVCIVSEESDLQESYEITAEAAEALFHRLCQATVSVEIRLSIDEAEMLAGELENSADIDAANLEAGDEESRGSLVSMRQAVRKLRAAIASALAA